VGRRRAPEGGWKLVPAAKALEEWTTQRLSDLKELEAQEVEVEVPETWHKAMNHAFHRGQMAGIYGDSVHQTASYDMDSWIGAASSGPDYAREVPLLRWDHSEFYDPDADNLAVGKTNCRHGNFMDGVELFDNKFFDMTVEEAAELDPHQRLILERGYGALASMGKTRKDLGNAKGGVYVGCETDEWTLQLNKGYKSVSNMLSMFSGRLSFCLNMKGPAVTLSTEGASGLTAAHMASESVLARGWQMTASNDFAVAIGASLMIHPSAWTAIGTRSFFSKTGRCQSFDAAADGYIRGDGCAAVAIQAATKIVEGGALKHREEKEDVFLGTVAGAASNHNGKAASLTSPHGPSEQECMTTAIRSAAVRPRDVEAVEANALGFPLRDAVEVTSHWGVHRRVDNEALKDPLCVLASKTSVGNQVEASGTLQLLKAIYSAQFGHVAPLAHLHRANPHIDPFGQPLLLANEAISFSGASSFTGVLSQGFGGTNVYLLTWAMENVAKVFPPPPVAPPQIAFWPGGGGEIEHELLPSEKDGYFIIGTWSRWETPQRMDRTAPGEYRFTVTLGENRWEQFQIWLDGDPKRCLHPEEPKAPRLTKVLGPDPTPEGHTWLVEGRTESVPIEGSEAATALGDGTEVSASDKLALQEVGGVDRALIGARYRVRLYATGKYRTVDWERLTGRPEDEAQKAVVAEAAKVLPPSSYCISADWNGWGFEPMTETDTPGVYALDVHLIRLGGHFQIVRNRDLEQVFYPRSGGGLGSEPSSVCGPDDQDEGRSWYLNGRRRNTFRIEFSRVNENGLDVRRVSWTKTGDRDLSEEQKEAAKRTRFAALGSWDGGARLRELKWNGSFYYFFVELGSDGKEEFQLVQDFDWNKIFHPSKPEATMGMDYEVLGPSVGDWRSQGLNWTIGKEGYEKPGDIFEVKVFDKVGYVGSYVRKVEWSKVSSGRDMQEAEDEGLVLRRRRG